MPPRLTYEDSYRFLQKEGWEQHGEIPPLPNRPPRYDDEVLALSFFRTWVEDAPFANLTLPRTYFSRTSVERSSFVNADLSESVANWNDFVDVDFTAADLTGADLRGNCIVRVNFTNATLKGADLRCNTFEDCIFTGADLTGARITQAAGGVLELTDEQRQAIDWQDEDGDEPDGG
jgi:uncharacterized protein YjbI with pentapeptide repeats